MEALQEYASADSGASGIGMNSIQSGFTKSLRPRSPTRYTSPFLKIRDIIYDEGSSSGQK